MIDVDTIKKETSDMDFGIHKENLSNARSLFLREILNHVSASVNIYVEDETKRKYSAGDWDYILGLAEADISGVLIDYDSLVGVANKNTVSIVSEGMESLKKIGVEVDIIKKDQPTVSLLSMTALTVIGDPL